MNITADNLESTLNYILELIIILYIPKNILLIPLAGAKKRYIALALSSVWLLYTLLVAFPLPNTFVILPVSLLVFAERPALISFTVISETLAINIITLISFYSYCMISHTKYNSSSHEYNDLITGIIIFCIITQLRKKFSFTINFLKEIQIKLCFNLLRYPCRFFSVTRFRFIIFPKYKPARPQASGAGNLHNDSPQHRDTYTVF